MRNVKDFVDQFSNAKSINLHQYLLVLAECIHHSFNQQYFFYFEEEDLVEEVQFIFGNDEAVKLEQDQYFYYFKDIAFHYLNENPTIENDVSISIPGTRFNSVIFFPESMSNDSKGIFVIANPRSYEFFTESDLYFLKQIFDNTKGTIERIRLQRQLAEANQEIQLIKQINQIVDRNTASEVFFEDLIQITKNTLKCQAVIFLMYYNDTQSYTLEAGNLEGRDFWISQTEFFRSLAYESEGRDVFSESYGGKHFKGEKYGLDKLETALIASVDFYGQSRGVFILLNKTEQKNFSKLDRELIQVIRGYTKAVLYRSIEKKGIIEYFKKFISTDVEQNFILGQTEELFPKKKQEVTILFMDLNQFTSFAEQSTPDQITTQLNLFFDEMTKLIIKFNGTLDKYLGDGVMAIFGANNRLSNHAESAIECAIAMQHRMDDINKVWAATNLKQLTASIGINTGEAVVGAVGCDKFVDFTAIGDSVNVASRLSDEARSGSILIGDKTWKECHHLLNYRKMAILSLKGKKQKMQTYEVDSLKSSQDISQIIYLSNHEAQIEIIRSLGNFDAYKQFDLALDFINNPDKLVRSTALQTVGKLNNPEHVEPLIQRLKNETSKKLKNKIIKTISEIEIDPTRPLLEMYLTNLSEELKDDVLLATIRSSTYEDKRLLIALMKTLIDDSEAKSSLIADLTNVLYINHNSSILKALLSQLSSNNKAYKIAAICTLGKIQLPQIASPLMEMIGIHDDADVSFMLARSLANISNSSTLEVMKIFASEFTTNYSWKIFFELMQTQSATEAFEPLLAQTEDYYLKYASLNYIAKHNAIELKPLLEKLLLTENNIQIKISVAKCLRTIDDNDSLRSLSKEYGQHPALDQLILSEIGFRRESSYAPIVLEALKTDHSKNIISAISAAGKLRQPEFTPHLLRIAHNSTNANITATVMQQLGFFESSKVKDTLLQALYSPIGRIRANAIESLMNLNEESATLRVERLLHDDNNRVRANAALACLKFGKKSAFEILVKMSQSPNKWMRMSCIWALYMSRNPDSQNVISSLLTDPDYDVILAAVNFMKKY